MEESQYNPEENNQNKKKPKINIIKILKRLKKLKVLLGLSSFSSLGIILIIILAIIFFIAIIGGNKEEGGGEGYEIELSSLSESTMKWYDDVVRVANDNQIPEYIPYIMAIIEVESKGLVPDVMQSSESAGLAPNTLREIASIEQGVSYLKSIVVQGENNGYTDIWGVLQAYNFGSYYVNYLASKGLTHSTKVADDYSRTVVAPSLGNKTGQTYDYKNPVAIPYNGGYLYRNGGNFFYTALLQQYVSEGSANVPVGSEMFETIMKEALKFEGQSYVWGGASAATGFDCSGLMQWVFNKAGVNLPRTAIEQWGATEKISEADAEPGDLIFFKGTYGGPNHISHVGIYVDDTRMYDSNGSGVGYHNWRGGYWSSHFDSIRRIKK